MDEDVDGGPRAVLMLVQLFPLYQRPCCGTRLVNGERGTPGDTVDLRMIDRTKSSTLLYQNTGILDVITTVGQHISSLFYDYLIILKRVHVAKDTQIS